MVRTRTARRTLLAGLATLSLGLAACGDDDGDGADVTVEEPADTSTDTDTDTSTDTSTGRTTASSTAGTEPSGAEGDLEAYVQEGADQFEFEDAARAECTARGILEPVGIETITATGLSPEEFFEAESLQAAGVTVTDETRAEMVDRVAQCEGLIDELIASEFADDADAASCVNDILTPQAVAELAVAGISDGTPSDDALALLQEADACISATETTGT